MLTRTKFSISVAVSLAAAALVSALVFRAVLHAQQEAADNEAHLELVQHLSHLRFALVEYLTFGQERARLQWDSEYRSIDRIIERLDSVGVDAELLTRVQRNRRAAQSVFERLVATSTGSGSRQDVGREELRLRLSSQLMGRTQDMISDAIRLSLRSVADVNAELRRIALLVVLVTALGMALVAANWFILQKTVLLPMRLLETATASIAAGNESARTGLPARADELGSLARAFDAMAESLQHRAAQVQAANRDLTRESAERKKANDALEASARALERSNAELEQFAYVASHDLQEPLRMVVGYVQLLDKRLAGKLDGDTREFMGFAVDGALRMQNLIQDILAYSRVGSKGQSLAPVDSAAALKEALDLLASRIAETGAEVHAQPLPMVMADRTQLVQLFQNIISNGIKFCKDHAPRIRVEAVHEYARWRFSITDNGIGIAPEYRGQLFVIFKRLHTRREYPGTGIGLAICKRIVERHGGELGIESAPDGGAVFWFTLPKGESP